MLKPRWNPDMVEGITCYERDETLCEDGMCLRCGCRLRNDRLSAQQREPEPPPSEAIADVSVDELLLRLDASQKACFDAGLHIAAMDIQSARALLASDRIERLDRLASGGSVS